MLILLFALGVTAVLTGAWVLNSDVAEPYQIKDADEARLLDTSTYEDDGPDVIGGIRRDAR